MKKLIFIVLVFLQNISYTQDSLIFPNQLLDSVLYVYGRMDQSYYSFPKSVTILTADQIRQFGSRSLGELLTQQVGISVSGSGNTPGQLQSIFSRGSNSNQTNILIDGIRLSNASSTDQLVDLSEISLYNIERIEILRGPSGTLYGNTSVGSTINIITKKSSQRGWSGNIGLEMGALSTKAYEWGSNASLNYGFKHNDNLSIGIYNYNTNGINATVDSIQDSNNFRFQKADQDLFHKTETYLKYSILQKKWEGTVYLRTNRQKSELDKSAFTDDDNFYSTSNRNTLQATATYHFNSNFKLKLLHGFSQLNYFFEDDSSVIDINQATDQTFLNGEYKTKSLTNEAQLNLIMKNWSMVSGISHQYETMGFKTYYFSNVFGPFELITDLNKLSLNNSNFGIFSLIHLKGSLINPTFSRWNVQIGLRPSYNNSFGWNYSFDMSPSYQINPNAILYINLASGFTTPSLYQLYSPDKDFNSGITRGNPNLKPENSIAYEIGFKQKINPFIRYSISLYNQRSKNNIDYVYLWNNEISFDSLSYLDYRGDTYINVGQRTNYGLEFEANINFLQRFELTSGVNIMKGMIDYNASDINQQHIGSLRTQLYNSGVFLEGHRRVTNLIRRPNQLLLKLTYQITNKLNSTLSWRYFSNLSDAYYNNNFGPFGAVDFLGLKDYQLMDLLLHYEPTKRLSINARFENIWNQKYSEIYGYASRGRSANIVINYRF